MHYTIKEPETPEDAYVRYRITHYHRMLARYRKGLKCRHKWLRRRKQSQFTTDDKIYWLLYQKVDKYYTILRKLTGQKSI